jgi:hypothetical protein
MKFLERLRLQRETLQLVRKAKAEGKTDEEAKDFAMEQMKEKYGATIDWMKILEMVMTILAMFFKDSSQEANT